MFELPAVWPLDELSRFAHVEDCDCAVALTMRHLGWAEVASWSVGIGSVAVCWLAPERDAQDEGSRSARE